MADILLSYEVSINLFITTILLLLLSVAFYKSIFIVKHYDKDTSTSLQYSLEKSSYLIITVVYLSLIIKSFLLPFFTYTLQSLSTIIPGAMCGAGVISANIYGEPLIILKVSILIITLLWLKLNAEDLHSKVSPYFKKKVLFFWFIYFLILLEISLELLFFTNLTTLDPVACCSTIYINNQDNNPLPFNISIEELIISFYTLYIFLMVSAYFKQRFIMSIFSLVFFFIAYLSIVYFFSTYIYQLPTHKCPYCLLQNEYYYIGYFIYSFLVLATFYALSASFFSFSTKDFNSSIVFYSLFVFFTSISFFIYLIVNGTFL